MERMSPGERFSDPLGLHPYLVPLMSLEDAQGQSGWVAGSTLASSFRFDLSQRSENAEQPGETVQ
jgi:hypothetical protein